MVGSYVTHTDASFFCDNQWPLCNGDVWPATAKAQLHVGHRLLAVVAGVLVIAVSVRAARQSPRSRALVALAHGASTLFVVQVIFGALTMWLDLTDWIRVVHLSAGAIGLDAGCGARRHRDLARRLAVGGADDAHAGV